MSCPPKAGARAMLPSLGLAVLAGCAGLATRADADAAPADTGICGTHADPGILQLTNRTPALDATVNNQAIDHGFTVVRAPAEFSSFELKFGPSHTAGLPTPEKPKFQLTIVGGDIIYKLTIDSWARSPAHVEMVASGGYDTPAGCTWSFPSPLFSYDITGGPDGGAGLEAGGRLDGSAMPIDGSSDSAGQADVPENFDLAATEAQGGLAETIFLAGDGSAQSIDVTVDGASGPRDASID